MDWDGARPPARGALSAASPMPCVHLTGGGVNAATWVYHNNCGKGHSTCGSNDSNVQDGWPPLNGAQCRYSSSHATYSQVATNWWSLQGRFSHEQNPLPVSAHLW